MSYMQEQDEAEGHKGNVSEEFPAVLPEVQVPEHNRADIRRSYGQGSRI